MRRHVAILSTKELLDALLSGEKTVEARLSESKIAPFGLVGHGDEILLKLTGGLVYGQFTADNVLYYDHLDGETIGKLRKEYGHDMMVGDAYWQAHGNARYATIIFVTSPKRYLSPIKIEKKDRRPWIVLER